MGLLRGILGFVVAWVVLAVMCVVFVVAAVVSWRRASRALLAPLARSWGAITLACIGIKVVRDNPSTLEDRAPRVWILNHSSSLDILWVSRIMAPGAAAIGKRELMYIPFLNLIWWAVGAIFLDRGDRDKAVAALESVGRQARAERRTIVIAPEGTRSRDGTLQPFKKGAFQLALRTGLPIHPVVAWGPQVVWPRHRIFPRPGVVRIRYLPVVETGAWSAEDLDDRIEEVWAAMNAALADLAAR